MHNFFLTDGIGLTWYRSNYWLVENLPSANCIHITVAFLCTKISFVYTKPAILRSYLDPAVICQPFTTWWYACAVQPCSRVTSSKTSNRSNIYPVEGFTRYRSSFFFLIKNWPQFYRTKICMARRSNICTIRLVQKVQTFDRSKIWPVPCIHSLSCNFF